MLNANCNSQYQATKRVPLTLCMMLFSCRQASPLNSISMQDLTCASVRGRSDLRITSDRSDNMYSNTKTIMEPWGNTSRKRATYGLSSICCSALISLKAKYRTQASQDPKKVQKNDIYQDKIKTSNFGGNPLCQATKQHLNVTYLFLVELCCFPVQCLEECWHDNQKCHSYSCINFQHWLNPDTYMGDNHVNLCVVNG